MPGTNRSRISIADFTGGRDNDPKRKAAIKSLDRAYDEEFALCMQHLWYFLEFWKTEDEENEKLRPFPVRFGYLRDFNDQIEKHRRVIVNKSRRLLVSNFCMARMCWRAMRAGTGVPGTPSIFNGGAFSVTETETIKLTQRAIRPYHLLPDWMKARNPLVTDNQLYLQFKCGGEFQAFPLKKEGPRSFGFGEVFFDEMAYQDAVRSVWGGLIPTLGKSGILVAVSTPNGKNNLFHDVWTNKHEQYKGIHRVEMDWWLNPEHDEAWMKGQTGLLSPQRIAAEFHRSFISHEGEPVWIEFNTDAHVLSEPPEVIHGRPMLIGWDLGYHFPAVVFAQKNNRDQYIVHAELQGYDRLFEEFGEEVLDLANSFYNRSVTPEIHFLPPDGFQRHARTSAKSGSNTDVGDVKRIFGYANRPAQVRMSAGEIGTRSNEGPRLKAVRKLFRIRADKAPSILMAKRCEVLIEGCQGGYCYPDKAGAEVPVKNESSHTQDGLQALVTGYELMHHAPIPSSSQDEPKKKWIGHGTGM